MQKKLKFKDPLGSRYLQDSAGQVKVVFLNFHSYFKDENTKKVFKGVLPWKFKVVILEGSRWSSAG